MLRKSARQFLETECPRSLVRTMAQDERGYPLALWKKMTALGWMALPFPEEYGGNGGSFLDLVVLLEEMGRACLPGPFFPTVVEGGLTILEAGSESQKRELLPKLAEGNLVVTMALTEQSAGYDPGIITMPAVYNEGKFVIDGTKMFVRDVHVADFLICVARTDDSLAKRGITLFLVDAAGPGIGYSLLDRSLGDRQFEVRFDNVAATRQSILGKPGRGWDYLEKVLQKAAIAKCAEMLGGLQQALEMSIAYAKERVQFGQPIGSFQAIQHHCANMAIDVDSSRLITYQAAWLLSEGASCAREVAMAKAWLSDACERVITLAHQVHGGVAIIDEHDLTLYTRRALGWCEIYGNADFHREAIAEKLGL